MNHLRLSLYPLLVHYLITELDCQISLGWDICYVQQSDSQQPWSCVANSPNKDFYSQVGPFGLSSDLWTCDGQGCQEWLDEAHCILNEGSPGNAPTAITKEIAEGLIFNTRYRLIGLRISFTGDNPDIAYAIVRSWITMPTTALSTLYDPGHPSLDFRYDISRLAHEYYHTVQATGITGEIIGSIRLEVEAYLIQALVKFDLGLQVEPWEIELATRFNQVPIPSDTPYCDLCWARNKLIERYGNLYAGHLLIESPFPVTTLVCSQYNCPDQ